MVRQAVPLDLAECVRLLGEFANKFPRGKFDQRKTFRLLNANIETVLVHEDQRGKIDGLIAGVFHSHPFMDMSVLSEVAWYSVGSGGMQLLRNFVELGKELGADVVTTSCLYDNQRANLPLRRLGFSPSEETWYKLM